MRITKRLVFWVALFAIILGVQLPVFADGIIVPRPHPRKKVPPYLIIKYHRVKVSIDNQVAVTEVDQVFENPLGYDLEGDYIFPLPEGAAVNSFQMEVDGKMVEGKVLDKNKARQIYESIVRRRKDPALLEYVGRNMFRARIYPIPAKGTKRVKLKYTETLSADAGLVKYDYPLDTEKFSPKPLKDVSVVIRIKSKVPIKTVYSPSHQMAITRKSDHSASASFEKTNYKPRKNVLLYYSLSKQEFGMNLLTYKGDNEDGYFIMFISPRQETKKEEILPKDVVFVLDTSGSMDAKGKMNNAKKALKFCLSNLNPEDTFNIVAFSDEVKPFADKLTPASAKRIQQARRYVDDMRPMGGTNIRDALTTALASYKGSENTRYIVFITDGLPTVGVTNINKIQKDVKDANLNNVRIFTFGVGYDVNTRLLNGLAKQNRGYAEYVKPGEEMEVKISSFYKKIAQPLMSDLVLEIPKVKTYSVYPRTLPDLFKGSQMVVVGRYKGSGSSMVRLKGNRGKARVSFTYEGSFTPQSEKYDFIPRLWAMRRIGYLLEAIRLDGKKKELVDEVVRLSTKFGIITPYTSYLVTEPSDDNLRPEEAPAPVKKQAPKSGFFRKDAEMDSGAGAVRASKTLNTYQQANAPTVQRSYKVGGREKKEHELVKRMEGKSFFLKNGVWTDSEYTGKEKVVKVKFGSDEYFKLAKDKKMARFMSIGKKVLVVYKGKAYLIKP